MTAWPALRLNVLILVVGGSAIALEILGARMLAAFYGLGPFLESVLLAVGLLGLGLGGVLGGRVTYSGPENGRLWIPITGSGLWTIIALWLRRPLLSALEPWGLELAVAVTAGVFLGPPLLALGSVIPHLVRLKAANADVARAGGGVLAGLAVGGVLLGLATWFLLLPTLGVVRATTLIGLIQVVAGVVLARPARPGASAAVVFVAVAGSLLSWRLAPEPVSGAGGVVAIQTGTNGEYRVIDREGARYLLHDGTIHAVIEPDAVVSLHRSAAALEVLKHLWPRPGRLLVLGMRGGAVAKSFEGDGWTVHVVEPDPLARRMAFDHFGLRPAEAHVVSSELRAFVRRDRSAYDLIVVDAFADNFIPPHLVTREFFEQLERRVSEGGILALCVEAQGWEDPLVSSLAATLRTRFETVRALPTSEPPNTLGAVVLVAAGRELEIPEPGLPEPFDHLSDPLRHWTVVQMNHAWANQFEPEREGAPVLTDDVNPCEAWGERINRAARGELHRFFGPKGRSW